MLKMKWRIGAYGQLCASWTHESRVEPNLSGSAKCSITDGLLSLLPPINTCDHCGRSSTFSRAVISSPAPNVVPCARVDHTVVDVRVAYIHTLVRRVS